MRVADQLRASGRVIRGRIGVRIAPVTKDVAEQIGLGKPVGALVQGVESGTPAEKAGIEAGDIIVKVDGRQVEKSGDLPRIIGNTKPGSKTTLQVFRRGSYKDVTVTVAEIEPDKKTTPAPVDAPSNSAAKAHLGLTVSDLTDAQKKELKVRGGVTVDSVEGAASRAGLREGDVILSIDNTQVVDVKQFAAVVGKLDKAKAVTLLVRRGEWVNYVVVKPSR
jgi:serine protease Do